VPKKATVLLIVNIRRDKWQIIVKQTSAKVFRYADNCTFIKRRYGLRFHHGIILDLDFLLTLQPQVRRGAERSMHSPRTAATTSAKAPPIPRRRSARHRP